MARSADRSCHRDKAAIQAIRLADDGRLAKQAAETAARRESQDEDMYTTRYFASTRFRQKEETRWERAAKQNVARTDVKAAAGRRAQAEYVCEHNAREQKRKLAAERARVEAIWQEHIKQRAIEDAFLEWQYRPLGEQYLCAMESFQANASTQV